MSRPIEHGALVVIALALFVDMTVYGLVIPVIPAYSARLGATPGQIGLLFAVYGVTLLAATPVVGAISSRVGRRALVIAGLAGLALSTIAFASAETFAGLFVARAMQGVAGAASWTAGLALLADMFPPERRGRAFGLTSTASSLGTLVGPPFGGLMSDRWGIRAPFIAVAIVAMAVAIAAALTIRKVEPAAGDRSSIKLLADRPVRAICALVALGAGILGMLEPMLPLDLTSRLGATSGVIGLLFAAATIAYGVAAPLVGLFADKRGASAPLRAGWIAVAGALVFIAVPRSIGAQVGAMVLLGGALALLMTPTLRALATAADRIGGDYGVAYAAYNGAYAIGIMVGSSVGGVLVGGLGVGKAFVAATCGVLVLGIWPAIALGPSSRS